MMRPRPSGSLPISEALLTVFIGGWAELTLKHDCSGLDLEWALDDQIFRAVWLKHRAAALAEAKRRGVPRPLWAEKKFGGDDAA